MQLNSLLTSSGLDSTLIILLLFLPVISTVVAISRHVIGLKSLSLYAPILLAYAFIEIGLDRTTGDVILLDGLKYGTIFFVLVILTTTLLYAPLRRLRLHYYPKVSLIYIAVANILIISLILLSIADGGVAERVSTFSIVLIAAITERIMSAQARKGIKAALISSVETYLQAVVGFLLFSINGLRELLLQEPWLILVLALINLLIGLFTGLRLTEYFRFYSILNDDGESK
ncbi:hypothetical protein KC640_03785 [Candidatus Dojkabacteria bacterium]|uniref:7 transmembrane helices usually fused to an inactive transglutaminase domain-containing protein n=1 Tax=Candidatus Dojkabacteria bacterium TaxID=2099670 RepID=A0A955I5R0_9BACT|nr:hypothetical protein [Candidatus Dojkabacteria bacterium]